MPTTSQDPLKGIARIQSEVLSALVDGRVITPKEVAEAMGHTHQNAYHYIAGECALRIDGLNDLLTCLTLTPSARESLAGIALHGTGIIAVDLAGREKTGCRPTAGLIKGLKTLAGALDTCAANQAPLDAVQAESITRQIDAAIADLIAAKSAVQKTIHPRARAKRRAD